MKVCERQGCTSEVLAKYLCPAHYWKQKRMADKEELVVRGWGKLVAARHLDRCPVCGDGMFPNNTYGGWGDTPSKLYCSKRCRQMAYRVAEAQ